MAAIFISSLLMGVVLFLGGAALAQNGDMAKEVVKGSYVIGILLGLMGPTCNNLGLGLQKIGVEGMSRIGEFFSDGWVRSRVLIWWGGMLVMLCAVAFAALAFGQGITASTMGSLAGFGLIVLTLFSHFVLKEEISGREIFGILIIIAGTSMMGYFGKSSQGEMLAVDAVSRTGVIGFVVFYAAFWAVGIAVVSLNIKTLKGVVFGVLAGSLAGCAVTLLRMVTTLISMVFKTHEISFLQMVVSPFFLGALLAGVGGVVVLQFGLKHAKAVTVAPSYGAALTVFPSVAGMAMLGEPVMLPQWLALAVIVGGVIVISTPKTAAQIEPGAEVG